MDSTIRATWFLDIDGVINAVAHLNNSHLRRYKDWNKVEVNGYPILYATDVINFINHMSKTVNVRMLTTWKARSVSMFAPAVGLDIFPFDDAVGTFSPYGAWNGTNHLAIGRWWKQNVIMDHIENDGSPFVWTDDDLMPEVRRYVRGLADDAGVDHCLVTPHQTLGLEPVHLKRIDDFVKTASGLLLPS